MTNNAFYQLWEAKKYGARAALYGRMINNSEHQLTFIQHLRWLADGEMNNPAEAVRSYHSALEKLQIQPYRKLEDDLTATGRDSAYSGAGGGSKSGVAIAPPRSGEPDFASMSAGEKVQWNLSRWRRVFG